MIAIFTIETVDSELQEMGVTVDATKVDVAIDMEKVESMWPAHDKNTGEDLTNINLVSGEQFPVYCHFKKAVKIWSDCTQKIVVGPKRDHAHNIVQ